MFKRSLAILAGFLLAAPWALPAQTLPRNDAGIAAPSTWSKPSEVSTSCPTLYGVLGSGSLDLPGTSGTHSPRIFRNGIPSFCGVPKPWPGFFGSGSYAYDAYTITNPTGSAQCVNMGVYVFSGEIASQIHITVYSGSFDPGSIQTNYLADSGGSAGPGGSTGLTFNVGAGQTIVVVLTNPGGAATGTDYLLYYDNLCVNYDRSYLDDQGRSLICYNSVTGQYRWSIFLGFGAGNVYTGQANISAGGNTLISASSDPLKLIFNIYPAKGSALGFFHPASWGNQVGSILGDINIYNDPPSDCIRQTETVKR